MDKKELIELVKSLMDGRLPEEEASEILMCEVNRHHFNCEVNRHHFNFWVVRSIL
mgnify:CR=1 FL=1